MKRYLNNKTPEIRPLQFVGESLLKSGITGFWHGVAMGWIRTATTTNKYLTTRVSKVYVSVTDLGYPEYVRIEANITYHITHASESVTIVYTFDRTKSTHNAKLTVQSSNPQPQ